MTLKELVKIASDAYDADGLVMRFHEEPDGDHGDGLAKFIAIELAETYDEDSPDQTQLDAAAHAMSNALDELNRVVRALESQPT